MGGLLAVFFGAIVAVLVVTGGFGTTFAWGDAPTPTPTYTPTVTPTATPTVTPPASPTQTLGPTPPPVPGTPPPTPPGPGGPWVRCGPVRPGDRAKSLVGGILKFLQLRER